MMLAAAACAFALLIAVGVWFTISRASDGYEISDGKVHYRTFDNVNWKVVRREVDGADPQTFSTVSGSRGKYGSDQHQVYFHEIWLSHADPSSFQVLDWRQKFSRDANHIYWKSILLSDDVENFQILSRGYSKDSRHVYHASQVVEGADPKTFIVTEP
ncbi:MAG: DKNYY domain-containing protein [Fuerstiella sp.]